MIFADIRFLRFFGRVAFLGLGTMLLGASVQAAAPLAKNGKPDPAFYRFIGKDVALENAANRGLSFNEVLPKAPFVYPRETPAPLFRSEGRLPGQSGTLAGRTVSAYVAADARLRGIVAPVSVGFPLSKGGLFDPHQLGVRDASGKRIPVQATVTSFWPDNSLKWVLLDFSIKLTGGQTPFVVEIGDRESGHTVRTDSPLSLVKGSDLWTISTGKITATIDPRHFNLLQNVTAGGRKVGAFAPEGVHLYAADASGASVRFSAAQLAPEKLTVEEQGPEKIVIRAEGHYANARGEKFMRYVTRLFFRKNDARVTVEHRHLNDNLEWEFSDFASLELPEFQFAARPTAIRTLADETLRAPLVAARALSVYQDNDAQSELNADGKTRSGGRVSGVLDIAAADGALTVAPHEFWQRWPKRIGVENERVSVALLPRQPSAAYGKNFPAHLMFPFVEGNYRMKWGQAFTERVTFDFAPEDGAGAEQRVRVASILANTPPLPILPSTWFEETQAFGLFAARTADDPELFQQWDALFERSFQARLRRREKNREYGFLNYGDWFGERARCWGNNEYDTAHTYFTQFARTGDPRYYRFALAAARHQADVDICHAYPDPYYVGANIQHSIGHSGYWNSDRKYGTWSYQYDTHTDASNGHTWAEGMTEAWLLGGEAGVMESALLLGEHITWAASPRFPSGELRTATLNYPRTAGWALRAILGIWRAAGDKAYLAGAERIVDEAVRDQDASGLWLRNFSRSKAEAERKGVIGLSEREFGTTIFQAGLTLGALADYYEATGNATAGEGAERGARLLAKAWRGHGWPYILRPDGEPSPANPRSPALMNPIVDEPVARMGVLTGDADMLRVSAEALRSLIFFVEPVARSSNTELMTRSGPAILGAMRVAQRKGLLAESALSLEGDTSDLFRKLTGARIFALRGPGTLIYAFKLNSTQPEEPFTLVRADSQGFYTQEQKGMIRIFREEANTGRRSLVKETPVTFKGRSQTFSFSLPISGPVRSDQFFRVEIEDPARGVWNYALDPECLKGVVARADPDIQLSSFSVGRHAIYVPRGSPALEIMLTGVHEGAYGAALLAGDGKVLGLYRNANTAADLFAFKSGESAEPAVQTSSPTGTLEVTLRPEETGRVLPLVLWAAVDLKLSLKGAAPWIAPSPELFFRPPSEPSSQAKP